MNKMYLMTVAAVFTAIGCLAQEQVTLQETEFYKYNDGLNTGSIADKNADNGRAVWSDGKEGWALQCRVNDKVPAGKYKVSVRIRMELQNTENVSCTVGIFDRTAKKGLLNKNVPAADCTGAEYKTVDMGVCEVSSGATFYISAFRPKGTEGKIFIDSIAFSVPAQQ